MRPGRPRIRKVHLVSVSVLSALAYTALAGPSSAQVTGVTGSAFGARASVSLFGGPPFVFDPQPAVTLPSTGGNETNSAASITFQTGPAQLLTTGPAEVSTQGTTGAGGSVTSSASLDNVAIGGMEIADLSSTCTANEGGATGSTTVTNGRLVTQDPNPNVDGDEVFADIPASPAPNTQLTGVVAGVGDTYTVVFNEQTTSGGVLTVNAAHLTLLGPNATGEVVMGQSVCGVTGGGGGVTTTTTGGGGVTTTTVGGGVTTTTTGGGGVTTTSIGGGVTTTTPCPTATCPTTSVCPAAPATCPTTSVCPTAPAPCPTTAVRGALVRTGSQSDLAIAWAALALTLGGLLLAGVRGVTADALAGRRQGPGRRPPWPRRRDRRMP
jgi:hypothetical protein